MLLTLKGKKKKRKHNIKYFLSSSCVRIVKFVVFIISLVFKTTPGAVKGILGHSSQAHVSGSEPPSPHLGCPLDTPQQAGLSSFLYSSDTGSGSFLTIVCSHQCLKHLWMTSVRTDFTLFVALTRSHSICYSIFQPYTEVASYP